MIVGTALSVYLRLPHVRRTWAAPPRFFLFLFLFFLTFPVRCGRSFPQILISVLGAFAGFGAEAGETSFSRRTWGGEEVRDGLSPNVWHRHLAGVFTVWFFADVLW